MAYSDNMKWNVLLALGRGEKISEIVTRYKVSYSRVLTWKNDFINGTLKLNIAKIAVDKSSYDILKNNIVEKSKEARSLGLTTTNDFKWLLNINPKYEEWRKYAESWLATNIRSKSIALNGLNKFFKLYLIPEKISFEVKDFLSGNCTVSDDLYYKFFTSPSDQMSFKIAQKIIDFIDWILTTDYSAEDDYGNVITLPEYSNPLKNLIPKDVELKKYKKNESVKNVLPYRYISDLRRAIVPDNAMSFKDLTNVQNLIKNDWYWVDKSIIDPNDPDCVYKYVGDALCCMWFPGRAIGLYLKLLLPLRTYQVRMLDSGEMDTFKYIQPSRKEPGYWIENDSPLKTGSVDAPFSRGVFRKYEDPILNTHMTGFYINTNKTNDNHKDEPDRGYNIPWQHEEALYWLAKLRDWQEKYNPIERPTAWSELSVKHLGQQKDIKILKQMGAEPFLFRNPTAQPSYLPLAEKSIDILWYRLLSALESKLNTYGDSNEKNIRFVVPNKTSTTLYPLHSLRVSLITAYALEGGVPMPILSKLIAGHASIIMTLYYTKMGIHYVTDTMNKAEKNILDNDKESFHRFIRDANYEQLQNNTAVNDISAYQTLIEEQNSGAGLIINDKGICMRSGLCCDTGGVFYREETDTIEYSAVPGFPEQNCVRCRWFITGPAFLPGLVYHFNTIGYLMKETGKKVIQYSQERERFENLKFDCEKNGIPFTQQHELLKNEQLYTEAIQKNDKLANDYNATLRLIDKSIKITHNNSSKSEVQLVPVGGIADINFAINESKNELELIQTVCNGAELFPETDASKAILQRSQIIDYMLRVNDKSPIMFSLSEDEQLIAGNQFMRLLIKRAGSMKEAIPYATGRKKLQELGFNYDFNDAINAYRIDKQLENKKQADLLLERKQVLALKENNYE